MIDWQAIKTEYITTNTSYRKLAEKYGVSYQAICHRSKEEGWIAQREQHLNETTSKTLDKISEQKAKRAAKIHGVADKLLSRIEAMVDGGVALPKDVRSLVAAVKDLKEIQGVKSELDEKEQRARIDALRQKSMTGNDEDDDTGVVLLPPRIGGAGNDE